MTKSRRSLKKQPDDAPVSGIDTSWMATYSGAASQTPPMWELNRLMMTRSQDVDDLRVQGQEHLAFLATQALNEVVLMIAALPAANATERLYKLGLFARYAQFAWDRGQGIVAGMIRAAEKIELARQQINGQSTTSH